MRFLRRVGRDLRTELQHKIRGISENERSFATVPGHVCMCCNGPRDCFSLSSVSRQDCFAMRFSCALALLFYAPTARYGFYLREPLDAVHTYASVPNFVSTFANSSCAVKLSQATSFPAHAYFSASSGTLGHGDAGCSGTLHADQAALPTYSPYSTATDARTRAKVRKPKC